MNLWHSERRTATSFARWKIREVLFQGKSDHQEIAVYDSYDWGRMLVLDGIVQTSEKDEAAYHEMLVHVPLFSIDSPRRILIIGGGDGGSMREAVKHPTVQETVQVELDPVVVQVSRQYLPGIASAYENPRAKLQIGDGRDFLARTEENSFDAILIDGTDPVGPGAALYTEEFYGQARRALTPGGFFVTQTGLGLYDDNLKLQALLGRMRTAFPFVRLYMSYIPTYHAAPWYFLIGGVESDPAEADPAARFGKAGIDCMYYTPETHQGAYLLPGFLREAMQEVGE